jgi:hypothetical protein
LRAGWWNIPLADAWFGRPEQRLIYQVKGFAISRKAFCGETFARHFIQDFVLFSFLHERVGRNNEKERLYFG